MSDCEGVLGIFRLGKSKALLQVRIPINNLFLNYVSNFPNAPAIFAECNSINVSKALQSLQSTVRNCNTVLYKTVPHYNVKIYCSTVRNFTAGLALFYNF